jgi:hypothetical protein
VEAEPLEHGPPPLDGLVEHRSAVADEHVEHHVQDGSALGGEPDAGRVAQLQPGLEQRERRRAPLVEHHHLAVEHGRRVDAIGQVRELRVGDGDVRAAPGAERHAPLTVEVGEDAGTVPLDLVQVSAGDVGGLAGRGQHRS